MKFIDEINLYISSGIGGNGLNSFSSFRNNKFPDGGNGGNGGNVYFIGNKNLNNFYDFKFMGHYKAENGDNGQKSCKTGKNGKNLFINVPLGTLIYDNERNICLGELLCNKDILLIAKGGHKGYGNYYFKHRFSNALKIGGKSTVKFLHLELRLLADIGLLGHPNVGKSLFFNTYTKSLSSVKDYKFTTLHPKLGSLIESNRNIVIADIPGIIKNFTTGKGLGFKFLKHISKTSILIHIFDITKSKIKILKNISNINKEIKQFDIRLANKEKWLIFNKNDLINKLNLDLLLYKILKKFNYKLFFFISLKKKVGLKKTLFNLKKFFYLFHRKKNA